MKLRAHPHFSRRGLAFVECLMYLGIYGLVIALAVSAMVAVQQRSAHLQGSCDDIAHALRAGELWRRDLRNCLRAEIVPQEKSSALVLKMTEGEVHYIFDAGALWRKPAGRESWTLLLDGVKHCEMIKDERPLATRWRCEVELKPRRKHSSTRPLFTFITARVKGVDAILP
jgi:hypothetical protein